MPGTGTVFADNAGVIGLIMSLLVWVSSYAAYHHQQPPMLFCNRAIPDY
ncbi:hypothetical protein [Bradyrhizobium cosmicum]|nr:hypothetical protein [Bradyrhizobium cosmicum]